MKIYENKKFYKVIYDADASTYNTNYYKNFQKLVKTLSSVVSGPVNDKQRNSYKNRKTSE